MSTLFANKYYQQLFENGSDASSSMQFQDQDMSTDTEGTHQRLQRIFGGRQDQDEEEEEEEDDSTMMGGYSQDQDDFTESTTDRLERIFGGGDHDHNTSTSSSQQMQNMFGGNEDSDSDSTTLDEFQGGAKWRKGTKRARAHMAKLRAQQKHPLVKGSSEAKARMAAIRAMRKSAKPVAGSSDVSSVASSMTATSGTSATVNSEMMAAEFMKQSAKNSVDVAQKALNFVKGLQPDYPNKVANVKKAQAVFDTEKAKYNTMLQEQAGDFILKQQRTAKTVQENDIELAYTAAKAEYAMVKNSATASTVDKAVAKKRLEVAKEQYNENRFLKTTEKNYEVFLETLPASAKVFPLYLSEKNGEGAVHNAFQLKQKINHVDSAKKQFQARLDQLKLAQAELDFAMAKPGNAATKESEVKKAANNLEKAQKGYDAFLEAHDHEVKRKELGTAVDDATLYRDYIIQRSNYSGKASNKNTAEKNLETARKALQTYEESLTDKVKWEREMEKSKKVQEAKKLLANASNDVQRATNSTAREAALVRVLNATRAVTEAENTVVAKRNAAVISPRMNLTPPPRRVQLTPETLNPNNTSAEDNRLYGRSTLSKASSALGSAAGGVAAAAGGVAAAAGGVAASLYSWLLPRSTPEAVQTATINAARNAKKIATQNAEQRNAAFDKAAENCIQIGKELTDIFKTVFVKGNVSTEEEQIIERKRSEYNDVILKIQQLKALVTMTEQIKKVMDIIENKNEEIKAFVIAYDQALANAAAAPANAAAAPANAAVAAQAAAAVAEVEEMSLENGWPKLYSELKFPKFSQVSLTTKPAKGEVNLNEVTEINEANFKQFLTKANGESILEFCKTNNIQVPDAALVKQGKYYSRTPLVALIKQHVKGKQGNTISNLLAKNNFSK